ncbi:MAG TPA: hypothetical protein VKU80_16630, partial [Planctomycetota bacterium]|nr:hypothetical protein [Planctomycetota bacterium]
AEALTLLGCRDGTAFILDRSQTYDALNALRKPEAWAALSSRELTRADWGAVEDLLGALSKDLGLAIEISVPKDPQVQVGLQKRTYLPRNGHHPSALEAFRDVIEPWGFLVLEDRSLRILVRTEASSFWKSWVSSSAPK